MTQTDKSREIQIAEFPSLKYAAVEKKKEQWNTRLCFSSWAERNIWDKKKKKNPESSPGIQLNPNKNCLKFGSLPITSHHGSLADSGTSFQAAIGMQTIPSSLATATVRIKDPITAARAVCKTLVLKGFHVFSAQEIFFTLESKRNTYLP